MGTSKFQNEAGSKHCGSFPFIEINFSYILCDISSYQITTMFPSMSTIHSGGSKMGYLDNMNWEKIKKELQNELEKGLGVMKNGAAVIQKKAGELTEEGKRQYKMLSTKARIHDAMRDLGAKVYMQMSGRKIKNPAFNAGVKAITARIKSLEAELAKLEGKADVSSVHTVTRFRAAAQAKARRKVGVTLRPKSTRRVKIKHKSVKV
jgi:hypothetical protein